MNIDLDGATAWLHCEHCPHWFHPIDDGDTLEMLEDAEAAHLRFQHPSVADVEAVVEWPVD